VLGEILASINGMPRPVLVRLTARIIDYLDHSDDDLDFEHDGRELDDHFQKPIVKQSLRNGIAHFKNGSRQFIAAIRL
jgi:hypothetical protein